MAIAPLPTRIYTADEYVALDVEADIRNEYRNGEIVPMTGGTPAHNEITGDLFFLLKAALKGQPYSIFITDQRLWIPSVNVYTYPDVMTVPRPIALQPGRKDTVTNPIFIAEILSDSTKSYDRDEKFAAYRTISGFQEYLLIDQYKPHVERYVKQDVNQWLFTEYSDREAQFTLSTVGVEMTLANLYENVEF